MALPQGEPASYLGIDVAEIDPPVLVQLCGGRGYFEKLYVEYVDVLQCHRCDSIHVDVGCS